MNKEMNDIEQTTASDDTLFKPGSWFAKIDFINHLILFNNVVINVLSEKEGGKTSFNLLLQNNLDQQIKYCAITAQASSSKEYIIYELAKSLKLDEPKPNLACLLAHINAGKAHHLIIIDDAQYLPDDFIKEAIHLIKKQDNFGFFHLCLISDHSIIPILNRLPIKPSNDFIHTIELSSLNENETRAYVLQRLNDKQLIKKAPTDLELKQFYQLTKGNMSKINDKLDSFISSCTNKAKDKKIHMLQGASILICAAFVLKVSFWHFSPKTTLASDNTQHSVGVLSTINMPIMESKIVPIPINLTSEPRLLISKIPSLQDGSKKSQLVHFEFPKIPLNDFLKEEQETKTMALVDKVIVIPKMNHLNPKPVKNIASKSSSSPYTIQLLAARNSKKIQNLKQHNKFLADTQIRYFSNEQGIWYILILGAYKNRSEALSHIKKLPHDLAKLNPWIRSMSGLESIG